MWELDDIEPVRLEPMMPNWRSVAGQFGVSFASKAPGPSSQSYSSWAEIGRWYEQLTTGRREITQPIRDKAREIVSGATDPLEKIRRLASYVKHGIRDEAIEIGIVPYHPTPAATALPTAH